ncbi:hypothetical protein WA026_006770 [Henosepilachna vigintioctopunctata]|uniref:Timeless n=1 Tax=Henosepilachna vigintioctopunctata TaxID=420089 RepID=A0AAW1UHZ1_9CUCU
MMRGSDVGKHSIYELNSLLTTSKEVFSDSRSTKAVMDHIKQIIESHNELTIEECDSINNCLLLLRNILHIPEVNNSTHSTLHNQIVWNLFTQSIDKLLIFLISCPQKLFWSVTVVQVIALLYKDQHAGTLQKLLNLWLEASLSESSEDNESNTSAPCQGSGDSSPFTSSDPTSDSSDTGGINDISMENGNAVKETRTSQTRNKAIAEIKRVQSTETEASSSSGISSMMSYSTTMKSQTTGSDQNFVIEKQECPSSTSEISDYGYVTQGENQEFVSTSSNDDDQPSQKPVHQKPHTFQKTRYNNSKKAATTLDKKELRRKKLVKRSKTNTIHMKGLMHHVPTDEDISNILKEFTVDFLLKGYGTLVQDLRYQLLNNIHIHIDTSHFFWLVTYFLKFATQLELDLEHLSPVLSYDLLSYLVFQGAWVLEELEIKNKTLYMDTKPCLRRLHLIVTAIREFLQAVETYQKIIHLNDEDRDNLMKLQLQIADTEEIGSLFLLLLRRYNCKFQSRQYLQDLILTNHNYLMFLDNVSKINNATTKFNLMIHLKKFAAVEIICQYGILLENFKENGEFINNCIFTMMHHIGGDLENISILFQPSILKTFSQIWETDFELCDDWADLIEFVIHKFINTPRSSHCFPDTSLGIGNSKKLEHSEWNKNNSDDAVEVNSDAMPDKTCEYAETHHECGLKIKELLPQNTLTEHQCHDSNQNDSDEQEYKGNDSTSRAIELLRSYLIKENRRTSVIWLQEILLEFCFAKLVLERPTSFEDKKPIIEPTIYYYSLLNLPVPLIPWTPDQNKSLIFQPFIFLLHKLGFYLPGEIGKIFVRIPNFWTAEFIYSKAQQLGPINRNKLKFDIHLLNCQNEDQQSCLSEYIKNSYMDPGKFFYDFKITPPLFRYTPLPNCTDVADSNTKIPIRNDQLTITIPEEVITCGLPVPELALVSADSNFQESCSLHSDMDCSPINQDTEHNSICDTASDLTRMYVSDEEDRKIMAPKNNQRIENV